MNTILIIDDDEDFHEALEAAVTSQGFAVQHAANGIEALGWLKGADRPDAILLDLMMPKMDGWQLLETIGGDPELAAIPCAVLSAAPNPAGLPTRVHHLPKPCDLHDLLRFIRDACA
jgi:two-component system response regulator MprA